MESSSEDEESQASIRRLNFWNQNKQFLDLLRDYHDHYLVREPIQNRDNCGWSLLLSMINGHHRRVYNELRMNSDTFQQFCGMLVNDFGLQQMKGVPVEEEVAIFLKTVGKNEGNKSLQEFFGRGAATIRRVFHNVMEACNNMAKFWITPIEDNYRVHPYITQNQKYSIFKDCIGVVDGTHIKACVPESDLDRFVGSKGYPTQNILAVCDFNMRFVFVMAGYEGKCPDSWILSDCVLDENIHFPNAPPGKYYLVDDGFANTMGFMAPYRQERYHMPDFSRQVRRVYRNKSEYFNHIHSELRSVIEKSFQVWKKRFHMVNDVPTNLKFKYQARLVVATMAIHNWLRHVNAEDDGSQLDDY